VGIFVYSFLVISVFAPLSDKIIDEITGKIFNIAVGGGGGGGGGGGVVVGSVDCGGKTDKIVSTA
jgi:hypothetical protein